MKTENIFYSSLILLIIGLTLTGLGLGKLFNKNCEGLIIGFGIGITISSIKLIKLYRRKDVFEKTIK